MQINVLHRCWYLIGAGLDGAVNMCVQLERETLQRQKPASEREREREGEGKRFPPHDDWSKTDRSLEGFILF